MTTSLAPVEIFTLEQKKLGLLAAGVVGGAVIAHAAFTHLFVEGMKTKERHDILVLAAGGAVIYAVATLFHIDERYWNIEKTAEWAEQAYEASQKAGAK
jgi:hypothetical protein